MYLFDTNVVSELRKLSSSRTEPAFVAWANSVDVRHSYLSVVTIQELEMGHMRLAGRDPRRAEMLRNWFESVLVVFAERILPLDLACIRRSSFLHGTGTRSVRDTFIAATAHTHNLPVVTRNVKDFTDTGVKVINPWDS